MENKNKKKKPRSRNVKDFKEFFAAWFPVLIMGLVVLVANLFK
jgi:hypothetical protein